MTASLANLTFMADDATGDERKDALLREDRELKRRREEIKAELEALGPDAMDAWYQQEYEREYAENARKAERRRQLRTADEKRKRKVEEQRARLTPEGRTRFEAMIAEVKESTKEELRTELVLAQRKAKEDRKAWRRWRNGMGKRSMTSKAEEQAERQRVFAQDQSVPKQGSTFHQHAQADADTPRGRYSAVNAAYVVGSTAVPTYPAAAAHQRDPVPKEEPLGYRIDAMPDLEPSSSADAQATGPTSDDPSPLGRDVGSLSSPEPMAAQGMSSSSTCSEGGGDVRSTERSPVRRYRRF